jgi:anti-sigma factor RsiW
MLRQTKLRPDASIRFTAKASLLKPETSGSFISEANYEEFFLLYVDEELDSTSRREVEEFAAANPALQQELNLLMQATAEPEHDIVFPDKSLLYKNTETERKPVIMMWWRVAAIAAMILLALGIFWMSDRTNKPDTMAKNNQSQQNAGNKK